MSQVPLSFNSPFLPELHFSYKIDKINNILVNLLIMKQEKKTVVNFKTY
jgi:hypothetical protein